MEEHVSWAAQIVNRALGPIAVEFYALLHMQPENPALPIPQQVATGLVVLVLLTLIALILRSRLSVEKPGMLQQMAEGLLTNSQHFGIKDLLVENTGRDGVGHIPFVGAITIFILYSTLLGTFLIWHVCQQSGPVTVPLPLT